jgi:phage shock protein E
VDKGRSCSHHSPIYPLSGDAASGCGVYLSPCLNAKEQFRLIDVGQFDAYKQAHLKGAINLPQNFLKKAAPDLDPKVETILYCQNGQQSMAAYKELKALGFTDVKVMEGGLARWSWDVIGEGKRKS